MSDPYPFDAIAVGVVVIDARAKYVYANPAARTLLGYDAAEILTMTALDPRLRLTHLDGSEYSAADCPTLRSLASGQAVFGETIGFIRPDCQRRWLRISSIPRASGTNAGTEVVVSFTDVSREVEAAHALSQREEQFRSVLSVLPVLLWAIDPAGVLTHVEGRLGQDWGIGHIMRVGASIWGILHVAPDVVHHVRTALGGETVTAVWPLNDRLLETRFTPLLDRTGGVAGMAGVSIDITERERITHALFVAEQRLRTVVMNAPIILSAYDMSGIMTLHTGGGVDIMNSPPNVVGSSFYERYAGRPDLIEKFRSALAGETHAVTVQLGSRSFEVHAGPQRDAKGRQIGVIVLAVDSTAQVKLWEEAERARAAAEQLAALRSELVASVSHELRTPLTAIIGYGELLLGRWTSMSDEWRRQAVERINQAAQRQLRLVEEILMLSHMDWAGVALTARRMQLAEALDEAVGALKVTYPGQEVYCEGPDQFALWGDSLRILQILANLLDNAAKYSPDGRPVTVSWGREGDLAAIRVRDQGGGIAEDGREVLFTRFGRIPGSAIRAGRVGTGLGLYLARRLAEAMHGSLELEATGPGGSVFRLLLPLECPADQG